MMKKTPPHIEARLRLVKKIEELRKQDVRKLPPERELCEELEVNIGTMKKALRQLAGEGLVFSKPRKGNFIANFQKRPNIGLILGERSETAIFVQAPNVLSEILEFLNSASCLVRLVALKSVDRALDAARQYKLDACIWYMPAPCDFKAIKKFAENAGVPSAAVFLNYGDNDELPPGSFRFDRKRIGEIRTEFLLKRGHKEIIYCSADDIAFKGFQAAFAKAGLKHDGRLNIFKNDELAKKLPLLLDEGAATALVSSGGHEKLEIVFDILQKHPRGKELELAVDYTGAKIHDLIESHPAVRVAGVNCSLDKELGILAAEAAVAAVKSGAPVKGVALASKIYRHNEIPFV